MENLKPYPFCGGAAEVMKYGRSKKPFSIRCVEDCAVSPVTYKYSTLIEAIAAWNKRAGEANGL